MQITMQLTTVMLKYQLHRGYINFNESANLLPCLVSTQQISLLQMDQCKPLPLQLLSVILITYIDNLHWTYKQLLSTKAYLIVYQLIWQFRQVDTVYHFWQEEGVASLGNALAAFLVLATSLAVWVSSPSGLGSPASTLDHSQFQAISGLILRSLPLIFMWTMHYTILWTFIFQLFLAFFIAIQRRVVLRIFFYSLIILQHVLLFSGTCTKKMLVVT